MTEDRTSYEYRPTESKYKGDAEEMYVTYDIEQETRGDSTAKYPKVKRVYISGDVCYWRVGRFTKKSGKEVFGVKIDYQKKRGGYKRSGYTAERSDTGTQYEVSPSNVDESVTRFTQIVELPDDAKEVQFHAKDLPKKYQDALQNVR